MFMIGYNTSSKIKYRTSGARNNEKWGMKNGKRNIISVNGWNCQCYFRFLYAADYSGY